MRTKIFRGAPAALALVASFHVLAQEVPEVKIALQPGIAYTAQMIMKERKLVEAELKAAGLEKTKVSYVTFSNGGAMNDAILSGAAHFAASGVAPVITLWSRALGTRSEVRACTAIIAEPTVVLTRDPKLKSVKDIVDENARMSVPAVKVSLQAVMLQMEAAKLFGDANYQKFDKYTVSLSHADGVAAVLSGGEVAAVMTSTPYIAYGIEKGLRPIYRFGDSGDKTGTTAFLWSGRDFHDNNPKTFHAVMKAFMKANEVLREDPKTAAEIYLRVGKESFSEAFIEKNLRDPAVSFRTLPVGVQAYVDFMNRVGIIKQKPQWEDIFFADCKPYWKE